VSARPLTLGPDRFESNGSELDGSGLDRAGVDGFDRLRTVEELGVAGELDRSGAVMLRSWVSPAEVGRLREVVDNLAATRTATARAGDDGLQPEGSTFWCESGLVHRFPAVEGVLLGSPVAALMSSLLRTEELWLYEDTMLVKEPGEEPGTPWHQDLAHYPAVGDQVATVWISLDEVDETNGAVRYVPGSHREGKLFEPVRFGDRKRFPAKGFDPIGEIDLARTVSFRTSPGDVVIHTGRVLHGTPPGRIARRRRALAASYFGPDVSFRQTHFPPARMSEPAGGSFASTLPRAWPA
jgi:hypothetical protein